MKKNLFLRTDILPEEVPILFDNKNVYLNFSQLKIQQYNEVEKNSKEKNKFFKSYTTIPLFFFIPKIENENRKISLLHPIAQLQAFNYILKYEYQIVSFCNRSTYSVRSPVKRNVPKITTQELLETDNKRLEDEFNFNNSFQITTDEGLLLYENYFSYSRYKNMTNLYKSTKFTRDKYKFKYFKKLDIQNFFPSIYTHALSWALFGDKALAKAYKSVKYVFPNETDKIMSMINFDETNGIVVGPEFSRIISELLLTQLDKELLLNLSSIGLKQYKDYNIYRYIDDYFIFSNSEDSIELIEINLKKILNNYNLSLNNSKASLQSQPFLIHDNSIIELKKILIEFQTNKFLSTLNMFPNDITPDFCFKKQLGRKDNWSTLLSKLEFLISTQKDSKNRIINYFLKAIRTEVIYSEKKRADLIHALEIISNIYSLNINYKSTNSLLTIYTKVYKQNFKANTDEFYDKKFSLEEKIFHQLLTLLKRNKKKINDMYEIITFMKLLPKKLPASFLCELLEEANLSYFSICTIAYYILDPHLKQLDEEYKTVQTKLKSLIDSKINSYVSKGNKYPLLDAEYFYYINDFSKYPGFDTATLTEYSKKLNNYKNEIQNNNGRNATSELILSHKELWDNITQFSYFKWGTSLEEFTKKLVIKTIHHQHKDNSDY